MKGILSNYESRWGVVYNIPNPPKGTATKEWLPLHPKYEKYYFLDDDADGGEVEFDIVKEYIDNHTNQVQAYAKLNKNFKQFSLYEHKETITSADTPQMIFGEHQINVLEISDEEIEKYFDKELKSDEGRLFAKVGAKWYRERLKQLNEK